MKTNDQCLWRYLVLKAFPLLGWPTVCGTSVKSQCLDASFPDDWAEAEREIDAKHPELESSVDAENPQTGQGQQVNSTAGSGYMTQWFLWMLALREFLLRFTYHLITWGRKPATVENDEAEAGKEEVYLVSPSDVRSFGPNLEEAEVDRSMARFRKIVFFKTYKSQLDDCVLGPHQIIRPTKAAEHFIWLLRENRRLRPTDLSAVCLHALSGVGCPSVSLTL